MIIDELDVRNAAMAYVAACCDSNAGVITRAQLEAFVYENERLPLIDAGRGIRNPRQLQSSLTLLSTAGSTYRDEAAEDGLLRYAYRNGRIDQGDNPKLRRAVQTGLPMILLTKISDGVFHPTFPVYAVADKPDGRHVEIAVDESLNALAQLEPNPSTRSYAERLTKMRLHQPVFRAQVLLAYRRACAICRLQHVDLLDAAHILSDADGGEPVVKNGLALCKIHHAAYDRGILGIRPDYTVQIRADVLEEVDGPMLRHGLQDTHGWHLDVPSRIIDRPDRDSLAARYAVFNEQPMRGVHVVTLRK